MPEIVLKYAENFRKIGGNHFSNCGKLWARIVRDLAQNTLKPFKNPALRALAPQAAARSPFLGLLIWHDFGFWKNGNTE